MTTKEYISKYNLNISDKFNHSDFVQDLASDFIALLEINKANDNVNYHDHKWSGFGSQHSYQCRQFVPIFKYVSHIQFIFFSRLHILLGRLCKILVSFRFYDNNILLSTLISKNNEAKIQYIESENKLLTKKMPCIRNPKGIAVLRQEDKI